MIVLQAEAIAYGKVDRFYRWTGSTIIKSILAGMYISFGGLFMSLLKANGYNQLICSIGFSIGLLMVVLANGELYTGNCLVSPFIEETNARIKATLMMITNYVFNAVGALIVFFIINNISSIDKTIFVEIAKTKADIAFNSSIIIDLLLKGVLCNIFVCLAVWMANYSNYCPDGISKFVVIVFPISVFIFCGFEHCVANMFFLPFGLVYGSISITQILFQMLFVTIGNWIGGALLGMLLRETILGEKIDYLRDLENDHNNSNEHIDNIADNTDQTRA